MSILRSTLNRPTLFTPQVNVTGQFHNLTSSGTFPLPGTDTRSSGPSGAVQLSNGSGGFSNNGQLYVQNGLVLDNSMITDNTQKPFVLALTRSGQTGYVPNPSVDKEGDIFYGAVLNSTTSFYGYKTGGWVDLAGAGGGGSGSSAPLNSIQFAGAGSVFQSSPLYGFYKGGQNLPSGPPLGPDQNALVIGSTAGQGSALPNATTQINYVSDSTEQVQFVLSKSGLQIELPNSGNNQEFYLETKEIGIPPPPALPKPPVVIQTRDGSIKLRSFRQTATPGLYGEGSVNIETNTGGINLLSLGQNIATGANGGNIKASTTDADISLVVSQTSGNTRQLELNTVGVFGVTNPAAIFLHTTKPAGASAATLSGRIELNTLGGEIKLLAERADGAGGTQASGFVTLEASNGNVDINARETFRKIRLRADGANGSVELKSELDFQDAGSVTQLTINGITGNIDMFGGTTGNLTLTGPSANIDANGTITGNNLVSTLTTTVGTDLIVEINATIGNSGNGDFKVITANTTSVNPALRTFSAAGLDQTKLETSLSLLNATRATLNPGAANPKRLAAEGSLAYDTTVGLLTYGGLDPSGTLSNKFIGNKVLLKSTEFIQSLSKNNARQGASINYTGGTLGGYESAAASGTAAGRKSLDLTGNVVATMINDNQINPGGINDVFCVEVQMPPRYTATGVGFQNEFSVLVEGTVTIHYPNFSGGSDEYANIGVGVWATDATTPFGSANPAPLGGAAPGATDVWRWGNSLFNRVAGTNPNRISGGADTWPRPMHASYYYNLNESQIPPVNFSTGFGLTTPVDWNDDLKTLPNIFAGEPGWIDPLGAPNSQNSPGQAGPPCAGSYFRAPLVSTNEYQITQVPFSIVCQNTNNTASVQKQYIWVTLYAPQGSTSTPFCPYVFRDGYYGFVNIGSNFSRYGGINTCSVYYVGDPDVMSDTTAA